MTESRPGKPARNKRRNTASPRKPQRKNGREKYQQLLDALEGVIENEDTCNITLANLSRAAGVPAASVYHFFPSVEAAITALAERHFDAFFHTLEPHAPEAGSWREQLFRLCDRARSYYESNPAALKVHFGPSASHALHELKIEHSWRLADILLRRLHPATQPMPEWDWREHLMLANHINESFWALSFTRFGVITDELATQGKRAAAAYLALHVTETAQRDATEAAV